MDNVIELPYANPVNGEIFRLIGRDNYEMLMEMYIAIVDDEFDEWFDFYCEFDGYIEHCENLSKLADEIARMFDEMTLN